VATTASDARERLAYDYLQAWNGHDPAAVAAFFAPDALYDDRGAGETARGRDAIRAHAGRVMRAVPDLRFELVRVAHGADFFSSSSDAIRTCSGQESGRARDFSCAEWRCEMTHRADLFGLAATGRRACSAGIDVATLDQRELITHLVSYYDGAPRSCAAWDCCLSAAAASSAPCCGSRRCAAAASGA
jgi:steroid delta-isomerase-like uncharacterized protein